MTDAQGLWRHHFSTLLRGDAVINSATREDNEPPPIDDWIELPPASLNEFRVVLQRLKNKAAGPNGFPAELFKNGGDDLVRSVHQLICRIWLEKSMPSDWNLSALCAVLKNGDPTICANYRGISLLPIAYCVKD